MHITHINNKLLRSSAFTLLEYCIVIAIIGLLAAIAIPGFFEVMRKSQTNACINNLRLIEKAKATVMANSNKTNGEPVFTMDIYGTNKPIITDLKCPTGGSNYYYDLGLFGIKYATCVIPGHRLSEAVLGFPNSYQTGNCTLLEIKKQLTRETLEFTHEEIWRFEKSHPELRVTGHQIMAFPSPIIWVSIRHEPKTNAASVAH